MKQFDLLRVYGNLFLIILVILFLSEQANNFTGQFSSVSGNAVAQTTFQEAEQEQQKYVYYTDLVIDGVNVGVITTTPEKVDDFLEYSWTVLDEYNFVPKEYTTEQARDALKAKEGSLIIQVDDELYRASSESVEALKKGVEFTKGVFNYKEQSEYQKEKLKGKIFSDKLIDEKNQETVNKIIDRLEGFEGEANFYIKTSRVLERMNEVETARRSIDFEERQELIREVQRLSGEIRTGQNRRNKEGDREDDDSPGKSSAAPGRGGGDSPGKSGDAPGRGGDSHGKSGDAPGRGGDSPGKSGDSPGKSDDAPGKSGDNPGQGGGQGGGNSDNASGQNK